MESELKITGQDWKETAAWVNVGEKTECPWEKVFLIFFFLLRIEEGTLCIWILDQKKKRMEVRESA